MKNFITISEAVWFYYDTLGLKVIPLKEKSKRPNLDSWQEYQSRRPSREEITKWLQQNRFGNVGIVCGKCADNLYFYALDFEDEANYKRFMHDYELLQQSTIVVKSGGGGFHVWFFSSEPVRLDQKRWHDDADFDIQLDGTYIVAPPSIHPETERQYEIASNCDKPLLVADLENKLKTRLAELGLKSAKPSIKDIADNGAGQGAREQSAFRYACFLLNWRGLDETAAWQELVTFNSKNKPPLGDSELKHALQSALKYAKPRTTGDGVEKTDLVIHTNSEKITILKTAPIEIHPAIDYKDGLAYVGVTLPCQIETKKGTITDKRYFLLTSNKALLNSDQVMLETKPMISKLPRWRVEDVDGYIKTADKIDPKAVYESVQAQFDKYLDMHKSYYSLCALWSIGSYFYHLFDAYPYLFINGVKASGKTKLLMLVYSMSFNATLSADITPAAIYRSIEARRCTLCIDEQEHLVKEHDEKTQALLSVLKSGFMRGGSTQRVAGEKNDQVLEFSTYSPKALANVFGIESILEDRCIVLQLLRTLTEKKNVQPNINDNYWYDIRDKLYRFYLDHADEIANLRPPEIQGLDARERLIWQPLFTLASFFEKYGVAGLVADLKKAFDYSHEKRIVSNETNDFDTQLANILYRRVQKDDFYLVKIITSWAIEAIGENPPPKWLTSKPVVKALTRLGFTEKKSTGEGVAIRLTPKTVKDCARRMGVSDMSLYVNENEANNDN